MADEFGQRIPSRKELGTAALSANINHVRGVTRAALGPPPTGKYTLIITAEVGGWRMRLGDYSGEGQVVAEDEFPAASVSDGSGAYYLAEGKLLPLSAPTQITVQGYDEASVLTYFWI